MTAVLAKGLPEMRASTPRRLWGRLSLVQKFALLFLLVGSVTAWTSNFALERVLQPSFDAIEQEVNAEQVARTRAELNSLNEGLRSSALDYAVWDDMYRYAVSPNRALEAETLTPLAYQNFNVDFVGVIGFEGKPIWSKAVNRTAQAYDDQESAQITPIMISGPFFAQARSKEAAGTYVKTTRGLYAIQSNWIRNSQGEGTPTAFFVVGRLLSASALSDAVQAKATLDTKVAPARLLEVASAPDHAVSEVSPREIRNTIALLDAAGTPLATLDFPTSRRISQVGSGVIASALTTTGLGLIFLLALLAIGVNRIAVMRLKDLRGWVKQYRSGNSPVNQTLLVSRDEIGSLARQFDQLAHDLAEAEEQLRQQSYVQGKADSAVGLLHNVRNSLGPLQAKYDKWRREDASPLGSQVLTALAELEAGAADGNRRDALEQFVRAAAAKLVTLAQQRSAEVESLQTSVNQIQSILSDYNFASKQGAVSEPVDLADLFRREVDARKAAQGIEIDLELPLDMPRVLGNRIHLAQVVGNLMVNAVDAMAAQPEKRLRVTYRLGDKPETLEVSLEDNGEGASVETLSHAFERGFSTRNGRSGGIGLHWSANAVREMGGSLSLASDGPGAGAVAIMTLPLPKTKQHSSEQLAEAARLAA